jgi:hypothetical protein
MGKYFLGFFLLLGIVAAQAQPYTPSTVEELDQLERSRILLSKQLEVAKLQADLQKANENIGVLHGAGGALQTGSALHLIKVSGLASRPEAVFLYGGYRVVAKRGQMVIPNIQLSSVTQSYVVLKDITNGKENVLWLSSGEETNPATSSQNPRNE